MAYIEPYYPEGQRGRPPMGIEKMLRMYLLQCCLNLSDEGVGNGIYDSDVLYCFMKINFVDEQVPDATTLLNFRNLLETRIFTNWEKQIERCKSSARSKVEYLLLVVKRFFGYSKTVYRGLAKNTLRMYMLFTSAQILMCIRTGRPLPA